MDNSSTDNASGNAKSTTVAPVTNEPELTADHGTANENPAAQPQATNLPPRVEGFHAGSDTDESGNFVGERGEGLQLKDPVAPTEMRNAAQSDGKRDEENLNAKELKEKYPAMDTGMKVIPPYNPVAGLTEAYEESVRKMQEGNGPTMGQGNPAQTSSPVPDPIDGEEPVGKVKSIRDWQLIREVLEAFRNEELSARSALMVINILVNPIILTPAQMEWARGVAESLKLD